MTDSRGRVDRQTEVRQERRRRDDTTIDGGQALNLAIPRDVESRLTAEGRSARWINVPVDTKTGKEIGDRMAQMTVRDDWDRVDGVEPRSVLINQKTGQTANAYLVSKRNDFIEEDRAKRDAARRGVENAMLKGQVPNPNSNVPATPLPDEFYADKANKIDRGSQHIT